MQTETNAEKIELVLSKITEKITSMNESPKICARYTDIVGELYILLNKARAEEKTRPHITNPNDGATHGLTKLESHHAEFDRLIQKVLTDITNEMALYE